MSAEEPINKTSHVIPPSDLLAIPIILDDGRYGGCELRLDRTLLGLACQRNFSER